MKVYVTKYALTTGIKVYEVEPPEKNEEPQYVYTKMGLDFQQFVLGRNAFHAYEDAAVAARVMRDKKVASLKKQLEKVRGLLFSTRMPSALR